jgi:hypothetical protein
MNSDELDALLQSGIAFGLMESTHEGGRQLYRISDFGAAIFERRATAQQVAGHVIEHYERMYGPAIEEGWDPHDEAAWARRIAEHGVSQPAARARAHAEMRKLYDLARAGQGGAILDIFNSYPPYTPEP